MNLIKSIFQKNFSYFQATLDKGCFEKNKYGKT